MAFLGIRPTSSFNSTSAQSRSGSGQTEKNSVRAYVFRFALELGHCSMQSACLKRANRRHPDVIQSPLQPARRPGPVRGDLCEESAAQLAGNLLKGHCGRSTAADEAKWKTPPSRRPIAGEAAD